MVSETKKVNVLVIPETECQNLASKMNLKKQLERRIR